MNSDKPYSNAEAPESSALEGTVKPALEDSTKMLENAKSLLDAPGMSWTEASGMMDTISKSVDSNRRGGSFTSGSPGGDDDDDEDGDDEASGVSVIVVIIAVGVIVVLAVLVLAILWCRRRHIAQRQRENRSRHVSPMAATGHANEETLLYDTAPNEGT